jgi:mono/diheme cytochrome c family protein
MTIYKLTPLLLAIFTAVISARADSVPPASTAGANALVWDALEKQSSLPFMTNVTYFTFYVTNTSSASVTIYSNVTSCDCTAATTDEKLPWELKPGQGGALKLLVNIRGKYGLVTKDVTVYSSRGTQLLLVNLDIPISPAPFNVSARLTDQMASQKDRQAVFGEHCAACHAWPAVGRTGESLFQSVCGICHTSEHRAQMVPDLALLNRVTDAGYWRSTIIYGKTNTLMPAFAKTEGGILDTNQIESLVVYLEKKYPSKKSVLSAVPVAAAGVKE